MQLPVTSVTLALRLKRLADFSIFCFPEDVLLLQSHFKKNTRTATTHPVSTLPIHFAILFSPW